MDDKRDNQINIPESQMYNVVLSELAHAEQNRWIRFNTFLVVGSIFLAAWALIFTGTNFINKDWLLFLVFCFPGMLLSIFWTFLGKRTSKYHKVYFDLACEMEQRFKKGLPQPITKIKDSRKDQLDTFLLKPSASTMLVTYVPLLFFCIFLLLSVKSFQLKPENVETIAAEANNKTAILNSEVEKTVRKRAEDEDTLETLSKFNKDGNSGNRGRRRE